MGRQLGQYLVAKGAINGEQLRVALDAQTRFGGRLGFNLVDLGFLSPLDLTRHLGAYHGIDSVEPTEVRGIRWDILNSVPREQLLKHRAIPIAMTKGRITVVMSDPSNVQAVDEMAFATGKAIHVRVAPDFIIKRALETYFGASFVELVRPQQSETVAQFKAQAQARSGFAASNGTRAAGAVGATASGLANVEVERIPGLMTRPTERQEVEDEWLGVRSTPWPVEQASRGVAAPARVTAPEEELPLVVGEPVEEAVPQRGEIVPISSLAAACRQLADARHRADVAAVLLGYASTVFDRAALFHVGPRGLRGWRAIGGTVEEQRFREARVTIGAGFAHEIVARRELVVRELRIDPTGIALARTLGIGATPRSVCGVRIDVRGQPVAVFYADDGGARSTAASIGATLATRLASGGHRGDLEILLRKVEVALEMVSVRRWLPRV